MGRPQTILIANPSPDVYGADLQLLQTVAGLKNRGWRVVVALPEDGPLVSRITDLQAEVVFGDYPVLRKASLSPIGLIKLVFTAAAAVARILRLITQLQPAVVYVNTVTLPWWQLAARLAGRPVVCHLHEAETDAPRTVRKVLMAPLWLATAIIVISESALRAMTDVQPRLRGRARLIYNGVPQPADEPEQADRLGTTRLLVIGRLSPRKAPDLVLEAAALLREDDHDVMVDLAGTVFEGYEWYETELRKRAEQPDLAGRVVFSGYCAPIWPVLERSTIVVQPSSREPFGLAVVEAMLSLRPVVATAAAGHLESLDDERTGLLVPADDVPAMAAAIRRLMTDDVLAEKLATAAREEAIRRFSVQRYRQEVCDLLDQVAR